MKLHSSFKGCIAVFGVLFCKLSDEWSLMDWSWNWLLSAVMCKTQSCQATSFPARAVSVVVFKASGCIVYKNVNRAVSWSPPGRGLWYTCWILVLHISRLFELWLLYVMAVLNYWSFVEIHRKGKRECTVATAFISHNAWPVKMSCSAVNSLLTGKVDDTSIPRLHFPNHLYTDWFWMTLLPLNEAFVWIMCLYTKWFLMNVQTLFIH